MTAQVLDRDGDFPEPGQEKVAILLLGVKSNHPLGIFAPDFPKVSELMMGMVANLEANGEDNGCESHSTPTAASIGFY